MPDNVDPTFLGEQIARLQADMRTVKSDLLQVRTDQARLDGEMSDVRQELTAFRMSVEARFDGLERSIDFRLEQVNRTAATNLEIVLAAIDGLRQKIDSGR